MYHDKPQPVLQWVGLGLLIFLGVLVVFMLGGCALAQQSPTLQHCDHVSYLRDGLDISVQMNCRVPIAAPLIIPFKELP